MKHKKRKHTLKKEKNFLKKKIKTCILIFRDAGFSFYFGVWKTWKKRHAFAH